MGVGCEQRFPQDFTLHLTWDKVSRLESQYVIPKAISDKVSRSPFVTLKRGLNIRYPRYAFTEQGVVMLSSILCSKRVIQANEQNVFASLREHVLFCKGINFGVGQERPFSKNEGLTPNLQKGRPADVPCVLWIERLGKK